MQKKFKKLLQISLKTLSFITLTLASSVTLAQTSQSNSPAQPQILRLSTTTSTENSGLLAYLLPAFEAKTHLKVQVISVGTGKALQLAKNGDVDVTLVHARQLEDQFIADGDGVDRRDVMYNDFILVGPASDPAKIADGKTKKPSSDILESFKKIAASKSKFVSRGDNSGTEAMEKSYWKILAIDPKSGNYLSAGLGMAEVLNMAAEVQAYTLSDRATFMSKAPNTAFRQDLNILAEGDPKMFNPYGIIAVNPAKHTGINAKAAQQLIAWITSKEGQKKIADFKPNGQQLFFPLSK